MKQELKNTIALLEASKYAIIKVEYKNPVGVYSTILNNASRESLEKEYGGIIQFFESLNLKGIKNLRITDRKKNGNSCLPVNAPYEVSFTDKNEATMNATLPVVQQPVVHQAIPLQGMQGLSGADYHKVYDYQRLEKELLETKAKLGVYEIENKKLEVQNLTNELLGVKSAEKSKNLNEMLNSPVVGMLVQGFMSKGAAIAPVVGLANPSMTELQNKFLQVVQTADDPFLTDLLAVVEAMQNDDFDNKLMALLAEFNH